ncbi:hypothetical protein SAMN05216167_12429 [Spirosoma endophyticum]|uniref:Uncharacterized protein n=1 Tax=Spirosoma endophyticum TaxID=662367 RepID=A0A1I2F2X5_9BACT|nr:hypothetical protein SAMN05216167_12429 [Spirosoma endophyticum]
MMVKDEQKGDSFKNSIYKAAQTSKLISFGQLYIQKTAS